PMHLSTKAFTCSQGLRLKPDSVTPFSMQWTQRRHTQWDFTPAVFFTRCGLSSTDCDLSQQNSRWISPTKENPVLSSSQLGRKCWPKLKRREFNSAKTQNRPLS